MNTIAKIAICFAGFYFAEHAILAGAYLIGLVCTLLVRCHSYLFCGGIDEFF